MAAGEAGDEDLLARIAAADAPAWEELVRRHTDAVYSLSVRMLGRCPEAEDAVQETFLRVRKSAHTFQPDGNARGWILKIACREAMKMSVRRIQTRRRNAPLDSAAEPGGHGEARAEHRDLHELLRHAVDELPGAIREAIVMHFGAEMSQVEIARELNCNQTTVSYRIRQGLEKLRTRLGAAGAAAVTPVALGKCLLAEHAPEALHATVLKASAAAKAAAGSLRYSKPLLAAKSGSAVGVATAVVLSAGLAIGGYVLLNEEAAPKAKPPAPATAQAEALAAPAQAVLPVEPKVHQTWNFNTNETKPFYAFQGRWLWKKPDGKRPGAIYFPAGNVHTGLVLPAKLTRRDVKLRMILRPLTLEAEATRLSDFGAGWTDGERIFDVKKWAAGTTGTHFEQELSVDITFYFVDRFLFLYIKELPLSVSEYREPYPGDRIFIHGSNWAIEEIELVELDQDQVPQVLKEIVQVGPLKFVEHTPDAGSMNYKLDGNRVLVMKLFAKGTIRTDQPWTPGYRFDQIDIDKELKDAEGD